MRKLSIALLFFLCYFVSLKAQTIPAPEDVLPHQLGETFTPHHLLVDYYEAVAAASPRVQLMEYGRTNEQRPLLLAMVSTPENLARLEDIRLNNLRRAGLAEGDVDESLDVSIVWISYSVHGNEAAGAEAGMGVIYDLANPNDPRGKWLENTLVIIDPSVNPDGYNRYSNWYRQNATKLLQPAPNTREHQEPWPGGRVNHYLFDLNRDWAWQTQVESQQRMVEYQRWMPHIHADVHEQGYTNPYYFAPAAAPFHDYITEWQSDFQTEIGQNHARYFDKEGWLYFTRESFDLFYPSYGDTYPTFNGAIGMTYEQGGHSRGGRAIDLPTGDTLTLFDRVAHHRSTSLSTVEIASRENKRLVSEFGKFFAESQANPTGKYKTYVVSGKTPKGKLRDFTTLLDRNGIEYRRAGSSQKISGYSYAEGKQATFAGEAGDLVISAYQPRSVLTQVLLDPDARLEDSVTYDITAWSLIEAYGLDAVASTQRLSLNDTKYSMPAFKNPLEGIKLGDVYAFVLPWTDFSSAQFLAAVLQEGVQVRTASGSSTFGNQTFPAGSIVINKGDNRTVNNYAQTVARLVEEHEVDILPLMTGFSTSGFDLGSSSYNLIGSPKIATVSGNGVRTNEFGQVWHFFENDLGYPIHIYQLEDMTDVFADDMDVLILPEGRFSFSNNQSEALMDWIRGGGKLISIGSANGSLAGKDGFGLAYKKSEESEEEEGEDKRLLPYGGAERRYISNYVPGAIVHTEMDVTYPLSFGLGANYRSLKTSGMAFDYLDNGVNAGRIREGAIMSGFTGAKAKAKLQESLSFGVEGKGRGQIIYLVDNPLYRGFWQNGRLLFSNALFQVN